MKIESFLSCLKIKEAKPMLNNKEKTLPACLVNVKNTSTSFRVGIEKHLNTNEFDKGDNKLKHVKENVKKWIRTLPSSEKQNLLINEYRSVTHKYIDSQIIDLLNKGGVISDYKIKMIHEVSLLRGTKDISSKQGGPGFLTQQVNVFCQRENIDSIKDVFTKEKCNNLVKEICTALASEIGIASPMQLYRKLDYAHKKYLIGISEDPNNNISRKWKAVPHQSLRELMLRLDGIKLNG